MRPGWGHRHLALVEILRSSAPVAVEETNWGGTLPLRIAAHTTFVDLPDELVVSVRCLVVVDGSLVMCTNADGTHPWPGGRREPGETYAETAYREVHEETGWLVEPDSLRRLGWLHFEHLVRQPDDYLYPHPDFLQVVYTGRAPARDGDRRGPWTDSDGYEASSRLVSFDEARNRLAGDRMSQLSRPFLDLI